MTDPITRLNAALEGRYTIQRELGEGGMATVYLADDLKHERKVALKVLKPELAALVGAERFLAEIKTTANLQHPHILPLFDSGEADTFLFYVMPYVEGESLRDRLDREHQLPVDDAVRIASDVAEALEYAHGHGVIHRDIKPANILIQAGRPVIADFGIALALSAGGGNRLTETGLSLGTPHYMSPEQATGDQHVGPSTDIYALGCVLYEMLAGEPPHTGSTPQAVLGKIIAGELASITAQRKSVPASVEAAIAKALEKIPADRFTTAQDFGRALSDPSFRHGASVSDTVAASGARSTGFAWAGWATAAVAIMLAGWAAFRSPSATPLTRFTIAVPTGHEMGGTGEQSHLAISHDGRTVAYVTEGRLHVRRLEDFEAVQLEGTLGAEEPFFSADDQWIGFAQARTIKRISVDGGPVIEITGTTGAAFSVAPDWSDDGVIAYTPLAGKGGIWLIPAEGGEPAQITIVNKEAGELSHNTARLLEGGRLVLFTVFGPSGLWRDSQIVLLDRETGERTTVVRGGTDGRYLPSGHITYVDAQGTVFALPFDLDRRAQTGEAVPVLDGVRGAICCGPASLVISDAGTIAYVLGTNDALFNLAWFDREGTRLGTVGQPITNGYVRLSPDGQRLATWIHDPQNADVWIVDLESGDRERVTFDAGWDWVPAWSPEGQRLAYVGSPAGVPHVYVRDLEGGEDPVSLVQSNDEMWVHSWSADGRWLTFIESDPVTQRNVYAVRVDSSAHVITIAETAADESSPKFSPNARYVAYTSDGEIYVTRFPEIGGTEQVTTGGGIAPRWSPQGDELFYWRSDSLMVRSVSTGERFSREAPRFLFRVPAVGRNVQSVRYDVAPDGRFLVQVRNPDAPAREIHVVLNWFEELKRLVPN